MQRQIIGKYRVKNKNLKILYNQIINLFTKFEHITIQHIYRENNTEADKLSKKVLKKQIKNIKFYTL